MKYLLILLFVIVYTLSYSQNKKWKFIHEKDRLEVLKVSFSITGVVKKCYRYLDGDFVIDLKLDSCDFLLNKYNYSKLGGLLEVEIVCEHKGMFIECLNYVNDVKIPKVGDHIRIWGDYVCDKRHQWCEIHPVTLLEFLH